MPFKFEKLEIWQMAIEMANEVHLLTRDFPKEEIFSLTSQMKRAADSISLNIAEGSTGQTTPEFKRFLGIAVRSGIEVVGCIHIAKKRQIISDADFTRIYEAVDLLIKRIQALRKSLQ